jgi:hypothetical protein
VSIFDFHLIALQLGDEAQMLVRALEALREVDPGETAFLPEYLAWTPRGSGLAFARLIAFAQERDINIITTLNLGPELAEDLPGHDPLLRYNAVVVFTRHGVVHVPQAKISTQSFEMDARLDGAGIGVAPYDRINRVQLDVDEQLLDVRFLVSSDVVAFQRLPPSALRCDLLVVLGNFAYGAEHAASRLLGHALSHGVARTALHVNAFHVPEKPRQRPLANRVEEVLDATGRRSRPAAKWKSARSIRAAFHVYEDADVGDFTSMCKLPRRGRVAVPRSRWEASIRVGEYPVTVTL